MATGERGIIPSRRHAVTVATDLSNVYQAELMIPHQVDHNPGRR